MDIAKYTCQAYEAAYIYQTLLKDNDDIRFKRVKNATKLILALFGLNTDKLKDFLSENACSEYDNSAKLLEKRLLSEPVNFFLGLDPAQAYVYHSANYSVSFGYGLNIAENIDFSGKTIIDVGGSSGGLVSGIKSVCENAELTVYDTEYACMVGEDIKQSHGGFEDIEFIKTDMFSPKSCYKKADYYILSNILHDWDNEDCKLILANILKYIKPESHILVYEDILYERALGPMECIMYGLRLCINVPGGRQRRAREILKLFNEVSDKGFKLHKFYNFGAHSLMVIGRNG
ncbi:MAG: hypothetical protein LBU94_00360 [Clostridiales bacterium]|nr:hypothetical protein [Clostridiales bacterium]